LQTIALDRRAGSAQTCVRYTSFEAATPGLVQVARQASFCYHAGIVILIETRGQGPRVQAGLVAFVFSTMKKSGLDPGRSTPYFFTVLASIAKLVEID